MPVTKDQVLDQLRTVNDPELHRDLVTLNMVRHVSICDGVVGIELQLTSPGSPLKDQIRSEVEAAVRELGEEIRKVDVGFTAHVGQAGAGSQPAGQSAAQQQQRGGKGEDQPETPQDQARAGNPLPQVKHIIAVGAGKGGVGKSTVAVNLAVGLARAGATVGLMDGDIYGPSLPTMLGLDQLQPHAEGNMMLPFEVHGVKSMTLGALVDEEKPLIWRGPMAHGAFRQIATQTKWGELDYLIIDLPPGTGDVPLTMAQLLPLTGAIVVCTPQKVAQDDARRAVRMFSQLGIEMLGIVENMSYFIGDDGKEYDIFGRGGAEMMAQQMGVPFLGTIPITTRLRVNCDAGDPTANFEAGDTLSEELEAFSKRVAGQVNVIAMSEASQKPTISIS